MSQRVLGLRISNRSNQSLDGGGERADENKHSPFPPVSQSEVGTDTEQLGAAFGLIGINPNSL